MTNISKILLGLLVCSIGVSAAPQTMRRDHSHTSNSKQKVNVNEAAIKLLERELEIALGKGDSATLDRILADDYVEIDAQGGVRKKADLLSIARARSRVSRGVSVGPKISVDDLIIRVHGDSAAVVGRKTITYQFMVNDASSQVQSQAPESVNQERFIRSYAKIGGRWQLVTWQTTSIAKR